MNTPEIIKLQTAIGTTPDGHWGPKSIAACQNHLRGLIATSASHWPDTDQGSLTAFYGAAGDESKLVRIDLPDGILYEGKPVKSTLCHAKVADSLKRILANLVVRFPDIARKFDGCYANRLMRNGSNPSLHARGAAIDFDGANNDNHEHWPAAATMPLGVMEIFAEEGWISAGAFWGRDAMHFQATR